MALTQEQWFKKLKNLVPSWVLSENVEANAVFQGLAKTFYQVQSDYLQHVQETKVDESTRDYIELAGSERSVTRFDGESLASYRRRVKQIVNNSNLTAIKAIVDSLLIRGESTIIEHSRNSGNFLDRSSYLDRNIIDYEVLYNAFTILIDYQIPEAVTFLDRGIYSDRGFIQGSDTSVLSVFENIVQAVNKNKAYGTVYRLIERVN